MKIIFVDTGKTSQPLKIFQTLEKIRSKFSNPWKLPGNLPGFPFDRGREKRYLFIDG